MNDLDTTKIYTERRFSYLSAAESPHVQQRHRNGQAMRLFRVGRAGLRGYLSSIWSGFNIILFQKEFKTEEQ